MITVETKYDKKTYTDYYVYDSITQDYKFKMAMIAAIVLIAAAGVCQYLHELVYRDTALVLAVMMIVLWVLQFFMKLFSNLKQSGLNRLSIEIKYEINEKKIVWNNKTTGKFGSSKWDEVKKVRRNGKYIYLYISKTHALVVNTEHIVTGTGEQLLEIARQKVENCK